MKYQTVNLVGGFYKDDSLPWSSQDCVNWIPASDDSGQARSEMMLRGAPGLRTVTFEISEGGGGGGVVVSNFRISGFAPSVAIGAAYSYTYTTTGGTAPISFVVSSGPLPPGLSLNSSTGVLSGTPTFTGSYSFSIGAADSTGLTASVTNSVAIFTSSEGGNPQPATTPAPLLNGGFESGNVNWTVNAPYRAAQGKSAASPGFVITNAAGRTGSWVMRWTGEPDGGADRCFNSRVANTPESAGYTATAWVRCTAYSGFGPVQANIIIERFADAACTILTGSTQSTTVAFSAVNNTWQQMTAFFSLGGYVRLSLSVSQSFDTGNSATIEFDEVEWDAQDIVP